MDPRIREHAEVIVDHSTDIGPGDDVVVAAPAVAEDLVVAIHELLGDRGATPLHLGSNDRATRAFLRASDPESFEPPEHTLAMYEETDATIIVRGRENVTETSDVPTGTNAAYQQANSPVLETRLGTRWCGTQFPTPAGAQLAEMSTEAYENFVYDAVLKDWDAVYEHQQQMVEILDPAEEVRIVSGDTTDVRMSVGDNPTLNDDGRKNLPGGEVFTTPIPESVEGEVLFDKPVYQQGREVLGARLVFENGEVVEHSADKNEAVLTGILETDPGARRLGELGIGMNRDIDRFTYNMLFDEKMGDTVHMAVGRAYDDAVGDGNEANESAQHVDMIVDMSEDSFIEVDGEVVQREGTFVFEEGFEA
jgi:aminopeptidase